MKVRSYFGLFKAGDGVLLGGVKSHESSRFESESDANSWLEVCVKANLEAGRDVAFKTVMASERMPEIETQCAGRD